MILLLQFRTDQSGWHELKVVYEASGLPYNEFFVLNPISDKVSDQDINSAIDKAKAVVIGGSGEFGFEVYKLKPKLVSTFEKFLKKVEKPIKRLVEENKKYVFGMCFGHQLIAHFLGGKVEYDEKGSATGIFPIILTKEGKKSKIFNSGLENPFNAVLGHRVSVIKAPKGAVLLAKREGGSINQAFQYGERTFTTQFHPELDYKELMYRLSLYPEYIKTEVKEKPVHAHKVLRNFFKLVKGEI